MIFMVRRLVSLFLLIGVLSNASVSLAVPPHNLNVGDTFIFTITDLLLSNKVNGTEYYDVNMPIQEGDKVEVTINGIESGTVIVDPTSPPVYDSVVFNVTEKVGDKEYQSLTVLDSWLTD